MSSPEEQPDMDKDLEQMLESYYQEDPSLGDRSQPQRALNPNGSFEIVLYPQLDLMVGGLDYWLDLNDWEITDTLTGIEYKKLPPEVVIQRLAEEDDE